MGRAARGGWRNMIRLAQYSVGAIFGWRNIRLAQYSVGAIFGWRNIRRVGAIFQALMGRAAPFPGVLLSSWHVLFSRCAVFTSLVVIKYHDRQPGASPSAHNEAGP
jgi:hypothetical protein